MKIGDKVTITMNGKTSVGTVTDVKNWICVDCAVRCCVEAVDERIGTYHKGNCSMCHRTDVEVTSSASLGLYRRKEGPAA